MDSIKTNVRQTQFPAQCKLLHYLKQGVHRRQIAVATEFPTVWPSIFGSSVWNAFRVTLLAPGILR